VAAAAYCPSLRRLTTSTPGVAETAGPSPVARSETRRCKRRLGGSTKTTNSCTARRGCARQLGRQDVVVATLHGGAIDGSNGPSGRNARARLRLLPTPTSEGRPTWSSVASSPSVLTRSESRTSRTSRPGRACLRRARHRGLLARRRRLARVLSAAKRPCTRCLEQALWAMRPGRGLVHPSDRGTQYLSIRYTEGPRRSRH
jgi:hypothetical protein